MHFKITPGLDGIFLDLLFQRIQVGEFDLGAEKTVEFQTKCFAVEVTGKIQDPWLYGDTTTADGGADAHIGNGRIVFSVNNDTAGIDTEFRHHDIIRNHKIGSWYANFSSDFLTVQNMTGQNMRVAQKMGGAFHFSRFDQMPDQRG